MYYNTTKETGSTLKSSKDKAESQDQFIFRIFNTWRHKNGLTPSELDKILKENYCITWPITSIRRAMSTLTKSDKLTKTSELRKGIYGKSEHVWKVKA